MRSELLTPCRWGKLCVVGAAPRWLAALRRFEHRPGCMWSVATNAEQQLGSVAQLLAIAVRREVGPTKLRELAVLSAPTVVLLEAAEWPVAEQPAVELAFREAGATLVLWSPLAAGELATLADRHFATAWRARQETAPAAEWLRDVLPW